MLSPFLALLEFSELLEFSAFSASSKALNSFANFAWRSRRPLYSLFSLISLSADVLKYSWFSFHIRSFSMKLRVNSFCSFAVLISHAFAFTYSSELFFWSSVACLSTWFFFSNCALVSLSAVIAANRSTNPVFKASSHFLASPASFASCSPFRSISRLIPSICFSAFCMAIYAFVSSSMIFCVVSATFALSFALVFITFGGGGGADIVPTILMGRRFYNIYVINIYRQTRVLFLFFSRISSFSHSASFEFISLATAFNHLAGYSVRHGV